MAHYPINLNLSNRRCLVIGGGSVGQRKVEMLLEYDAAVTVVSPDVTHYLRSLVDQGLIRHMHRLYTPEVLAGAFLVIAATDTRGVNKAISLECQRLGILVNVADDPELCSFYVPAIVHHDDFTIAVSTSGNSPALAKRVRENLESEFGPEYGDFAGLLGEIRDEVKAKYPEQEDRSQAYLRVLDSDVLDLLKQGKRDEAMEKARKCI